MRFVLVECPEGMRRWGIPQWRATAVTKAKTVDIFFYAANEADAKQHIRNRYPAIFSDEKFRSLGEITSILVKRLQ